MLLQHPLNTIHTLDQSGQHGSIRNPDVVMTWAVEQITSPRRVEVEEDSCKCVQLALHLETSSSSFPLWKNRRIDYEPGTTMTFSLRQAWKKFKPSLME